MFLIPDWKPLLILERSAKRPRGFTEHQRVIKPLNVSDVALYVSALTHYTERFAFASKS